MTVKYIVNETGNPIEVLIPYKEFQLLQPLFSLLTEDEVTPKKIQIPFLSQMIQEDKEERF